jgi:N-methylhydantoinase B
VPGSGGRGRHRGGLGLTRSWRIDSERAVFTAQMDRFRNRPFGLAGGEPGGAGRLTLIRAGQEQALHSKVANMVLQKGDVIRLETSGGGGFGLAEQRAVLAQKTDALEGYVG